MSFEGAGNRMQMTYLAIFKFYLYYFIRVDIRGWVTLGIDEEVISAIDIDGALKSQSPWSHEIWS